MCIRDRVTEAREFQPNGAPPAFPALQDGSVSTWQIQGDGSLSPINLDVASGTNNTGRTACWLDFSDENTFFVSNAIEAGLASYSFNDGQIALLDQTAAQGTGATGNTTDPAAAFGTTEGWIDLWISDDGQYLYQCYGLTGTVGVFEIDGTELTLIQEISGDLPQNNVQGIVSVGQPVEDNVTVGALNGGEAFTESGATAITLCSGDNVSNIIQLANNATNEPGVQYAYIMAYDDGRIAGLIPSGLIQFEGSPTLTARIYGFAYTGNVTFEPWDNINTTILSDGEFSLSNNSISLTIQNGGCTSAIDSGFSTNLAESRSAKEMVYITAEGIIVSAEEYEQLLQLERRVEILPNPFNEQIKVDYSAKTETARLSIYHISGAKVYEQVLPLGSSSHVISTTNMESGVYYMTISEKNSATIIQHQIVKQSLR